MSEYTETATILCPEQYIDICNHLAACSAKSITSLNTFVSCIYEKGSVKYSVAHASVKATFLGDATGELSVPEDDTEGLVSLEKAQQAQALLRFDVVDTENTICVKMNGDPEEFIASAELVKIPFEIG